MECNSISHKVGCIFLKPKISFQFNMCMAVLTILLDGSASLGNDKLLQ
jgi:hypothetical protein